MDQQRELVEGTAENNSTAAMPAWQRRTLLGLLVLLSAFFATLYDWGIREWPQWFMVWTGACLIAQPCLLAVWAALADGPVSSRLPQALGLAAALGLTAAWGTTHLPSHGVSALGWSFVPVAAVGCLFPVLLVIRRRYGWRIQLAEAGVHGNGRHSQFGLRQLLAWTGTIAVLLAMARELDGGFVGVGAVPLELLITLAMIVTAAAIWIPMVVAATGLMLASNDRRRFALQVLIATVLGTCLTLVALIFELYLANLPMNPAEIIGLVGENAVVLLPLEFGLIATVFGSLWILRRCGYRLVRARDHSLAAELPAGLPVRRLNFVRPAIAMLFCIALLCWPAWQAEQARAKSRRLQALTQDLTSRGVKIDQYDVTVSRPLDDAGLRQLQEYGRTETVLRLRWPAGDLSDDHLRYLAEMNDLQLLQTEGPGITDAGLVTICRFSRIENLSLAGAQITDAELASLKELHNLESLDLSGAPQAHFGELMLGTAAATAPDHRGRITDAGVTRLCDLRGLKYLRLAQHDITDAAIPQIATLPRLKDLDLTETLITDAGLRSLRTATGLSCLVIYRTSVTAAGVAELKSLRNLRLIYLPDATVGGTAVTAFQQANPNDGWTHHGTMLFSNASGIRLQGGIPRFSSGPTMAAGGI